MRGQQAATGRDRFGRELRRLRERAGLTQVQLAARLGYDHTYLSKLESGARAPRISFASAADDLLNAGGALLALATQLRARRRSGGEAVAVTAPLPCPPPADGPAQPRRSQRVELPAYGVMCPLHESAGCTVTVPAAGLAEVLQEGTGTVGAATVHGFAALLTTYIEADLDSLSAASLPSEVEQALRALIGLVPRARGAVAVGVLKLAAQYADLAGWLRVERGQHGIGMAWLHRSLEWASASGQHGTACEALTNMSVLALMEGDAATALEYGNAAAAVGGDRRWIAVEANLHLARGHALLGDQREFTRLADQARRAVARLGERDRVEAPWFRDAEGEAWIASHLAAGLRDLAQTTGDRAIAGRAVRFAETSLANVPARMHGSKLLLTLRLADSHACAGDLDAAVAVARPVIPSVLTARTTRIDHELDRLRGRLGERSGELFDDRSAGLTCRH
ncbi:helix-turn-helix transcriptional regulator [Crossiella sp. SN42]|uniref:helix-turn-helix domain-containing protein n=1 Tax=Crossiella sp. SN42 TaxID=2944808 RepID=UPI00207CD94C|nr:helix-turn-helix transcriptional regulator [Crossiella sp. SN42]MCO1580393.1 helix-turn-helix transcriptional regulator [Crossiella sp. SN42]